MGGPTFIVWVVTQQVCVDSLWWGSVNRDAQGKAQGCPLQKKLRKTNRRSALPSQHSSSLVCGVGEETKWWSKNPQARLYSNFTIIFDKTTLNMLRFYKIMCEQNFLCWCRNTHSHTMKKQDGSVFMYVWEVLADRCSRSQRWSMVAIVTVWAEGAVSILSMQETGPLRSLSGFKMGFRLLWWQHEETYYRRIITSFYLDSDKS